MYQLVAERISGQSVRKERIPVRGLKLWQRPHYHQCCYVRKERIPVRGLKHCQ